MSTETNTNRHGLTFWGALQVLFIGLKLTGNIDWPWWQVFLPIIIELVVIAVALLIIGAASYDEWR